jgi:hypothetical protein
MPALFADTPIQISPLSRARSHPMPFASAKSARRARARRELEQIFGSGRKRFRSSPRTRGGNRAPTRRSRPGRSRRQPHSAKPADQGLREHPCGASVTQDADRIRVGTNGSRCGRAVTRARKWALARLPGDERCGRQSNGALPHLATGHLSGFDTPLPMISTVSGGRSVGPRATRNAGIAETAAAASRRARPATEARDGRR